MEALIFNILTQNWATILAIVLGIITISRGQHHLHLSLNSRLDELLDATKKLAHAEGRAEGRKEGRAAEAARNGTTGIDKAA